jgi:prepilin-type N-terminal cleavage/methylation domain-containing protein
MSPAGRVHRSRAFTLIELLTVIAIIVVLAGIAIGGIKGAKNRAAIARAKTELAALASALEDYKRYYGDYPQLGVGGGITQATVEPANLTAGPGRATVQARLFNCLTGVFGPRAFAATDRQNGPSFLDTRKFTLEGTLSTTFQVPALNPPNHPFKTEENVGLLDPWGRRYLYYYKTVAAPAAWQAPGYVLYSVGPDGKQDTAPPVTGILTRAQLTTANNADNIYANP